MKPQVLTLKVIRPKARKTTRELASYAEKRGQGVRKRTTQVLPWSSDEERVDHSQSQKKERSHERGSNNTVHEISKTKAGRGRAKGRSPMIH